MIDDKLVMQIYSGLYSVIIGSAVVILMTSGQTNPTAVIAFTSAYSFILCVFAIICVLLGMSLDTNQYVDLGFFRKIIKYVFLFFPFLVVMIVILWVLVLLNKYYDKIIENKVSDYYTSFINTTSILLFIQIYMLLGELTEMSFKNFELPKKTAAMLRLFGLLNIISVFTLQIILKYYTTDC
jgi:hypothetical protein